ncbi:AAA family ATPase [Crocosphaera sp. Alani8]|uniref:AAA family ATPase n=1 Tax=Crocosphaera sp. Alani8 TaxID=3038952 RepID=UPI00313B5D22
MLDNNDVLKILDYAIPILPVTQLAGIVNHVRTDKNGNYICFIKPLNQDWFTSEGELIDSLFCYLGESPRDINDQEISNDNYVSFQWDKSQWEIHKRKNAINIQNITEENAQNLLSTFKNTIKNKLEQEIKQKSIEIEERSLEINQRLEDLKIEEEIVREHYEENQKNEHRLKNMAQQLEPYGILLGTSEENQQNNQSQLSDLPENFAQEWTNNLQNNGLYVTQQIAKSYLISIFSALYLGRLVLLNGTVGVGKTSIIKHSATILGGKSNIIPVRPAWLDPSDLLGFYDPLQEIFRPAPFLTALNEARNNQNRLHLVCLDELNLAKIENYASDVLSQLEYSQQNKEDGLMLYSREIWESIKQECLYLHETTDFKSQQRLKVIQNLLKNYPSYKFSIPNNLVLLGTLNSDETTYDLSPKLIDRSFIITYPPANLEINFDGKTKSSNQDYPSISTKSIIKKIKEYKNTILEEQEVSQNWNTIVEWNKLYFCESQLGRPLSYRVLEDYRIFNAVGKLLGLQENECFGYFIFTKILPRIYFFKENEKNEQFQEWLQKLEEYEEYDLGNILDNLQKQSEPENQQIQLVSYWG